MRESEHGANVALATQREKVVHIVRMAPMSYRGIVTHGLMDTEVIACRPRVDECIAAVKMVAARRGWKPIIIR